MPDGEPQYRRLTIVIGLGLFFVTQGIGRGLVGMNANAMRMVASAGAGLVAIYELDLGVAGFFAAVAAGFCLYAAMLVYSIFNLKTPNAAAVAASA